MNTENKKIKQRKKRIWQSCVTVLASIVVFVTTYALIIPAITWEKTLICECEEHVHTDDCYNSNGQLKCSKAEHKHTDACFDAPKAIEKIYVCGKTEHVHTEDCYFSDGTMKCTIPEHNHTWKCRNEKRTYIISTECSNGVTVTLMGEEDSFPYPVSEVTLKAEPVKDTRIDSLLEQADYSGCESLALDITLWHGTEEIQPKGEVSLIFEGIDGADEFNTQVLHVEPEKSELQEMKSCTEDGIVSLETDHFSIYVVSIPVHTYEFYVDGELTAKQIVKSGDELLRPETPSKDNYKFLGWSFGSTLGAPYFNAFGEQSTVETGTTKLYADLSEVYYVFFMQPNEEATEGYKVFATKEGIAGTVVDTSDIHFKVDESHELVGWSLTENGTVSVDQVTIVDNNITLYPIIEDGYWITFETLTADSYVKPVYYQASENTVAPAEPTRAGYQFKYWSTSSTGTAYSFGNTLSSSVTLYAVWQPVQVDYTVIHWIENANYYDDDDTAAGIMPPAVIDAEEYSFGFAETKRGLSGSQTAASANTTTYDTAHWTAQPITNTEIDGHGNTIVNVYYKRTVFTIDFKIGLETFREPYNNPYADGIKSGYAIPLTNGKNLQIVAKWGATVSNLWPDHRTETVRTFTVNKSNSSQNPKLATYHLMLNGNAKTYSGTVSEVFPVGSQWQVEDGTTWWEEYDHVHYGWYASAMNAMPDWNDTYYYRDINETDKPKYARLVTNICVDPLPGWPEEEIDITIDGQDYVIRSVTYFETGHREWWTTEPDEVEGFTFKEGTLPDGLATFAVNNDNRDYVNKGYIGNPYEETINGKKFLIETSNYVYSRNQYDIHFMSEGVEINTTEDVYFEQDISDISYTPTREGYSFKGWYDNEALAGAEFSFDDLTMPAKDITLYAKWIPNTVTVRFFNDIENPELLSEQTYDIGEVIDLEHVPDISREDEKFIYWMEENENGELEPFNMSTYLDADVDLYPYFVPNGKYTVTYDLNDANAIEIIGESVTGDPPVDQHEGGYAYGSHAEIELLPNNLTIPEGLVFLHWNTEADDSGTDLTPQEKLFIDHDYTLYAIWGPDPEYHTTYLTYHSNRDDENEEETSVSKTITMNDQIMIKNIMFFYPGYTFVGWNTESDGSGVWWDVGTDVRLDGTPEDNNLYAIWQELPVVPGDIDFQKYEKETSATGKEGSETGIENVHTICLDILPPEKKNIAILLVLDTTSSMRVSCATCGENQSYHPGYEKEGQVHTITNWEGDNVQVTPCDQFVERKGISQVAAAAFINKLGALSDYTENLYVRFVPFGGTANSDYMDWIDLTQEGGVTAAQYALANLPEYSGTNVSAGLRSAYEITSGDLPNGVTAENTYVLLMTDGAQSKSDLANLPAAALEDSYVEKWLNIWRGYPHFEQVENQYIDKGFYMGSPYYAELITDDDGLNSNLYTVLLGNNLDYGDRRGKEKNQKYNPGIGIDSHDFLSSFSDYSVFATSARDMDNYYNAILQSLAPVLVNISVTDPMSEHVDFLTFTDSDGNNQSNSEAVYDPETRTITWNPVTVDADGHYRLYYNVRIKTEAEGFVDGQLYPANETTTAEYTLIFPDGHTETSQKNSDIPEIEGMLGQLSFTKVSANETPLSGAQFKLVHDINCPYCHGATFDDITFGSDANGNVSVSNIPSGHTYKLFETSAPDGYLPFEGSLDVVVSYGNVTVSGAADVWNNEGHYLIDPPATVKLTITKEVVGVTGIGNFPFEVILSDGDGNPVLLPTGAFSPENSVAYTIAADGKITFTLGHQQSIVIADIPYGAVAAIAEINHNGFTVAFTDNNGYVKYSSNDSIELKSDREITVKNMPGSVLPETGGIGTTTIYAISALLMLGALTIGYVLWRRREGRGDV